MTALETVEVTRDLWQSWGVTVGGIVGAAVILTALAKVPGGRAVFKFLVADPVSRWISQTIDHKFIDSTITQTAAMKETVRQEVAECLAPVAKTVAEINQAVNTVSPGTPPIKDRVARLERGQAETHGQLNVLTNMVQSLVERP